MIMTNTNPAQTTSSEMSPWPDSAMTKKKKKNFAALYPVVDPVILELMLVYRLCQLLAARSSE